MPKRETVVVKVHLAGFSPGHKVWNLKVMLDPGLHFMAYVPFYWKCQRPFPPHSNSDWKNVFFSIGVYLTCFTFYFILSFTLSLNPLFLISLIDFSCNKQKVVSPFNIRENTIHQIIATVYTSPFADIFFFIFWKPPFYTVLWCSFFFVCLFKCRIF